MCGGGGVEGVVPSREVVRESLSVLELVEEEEEEECCPES